MALCLDNIKNDNWGVEQGIRLFIKNIRVNSKDGKIISMPIYMSMFLSE